jgi:hypothetical protein
MTTTTTTQSNVSLCIPRVFSNINEERIRAIFRKLSLGNICRIDFVPFVNAKGEKHNRVFIHFDEWFKNVNADTSLARLQEGKEIKIIYDDPWFWKVSLYRKKETTPRPNPNARPNPRIEYDNNIQTPPPLPPKQSDVVTLPIKPKKMHYRQHSHNNNNMKTNTTTTSPIQPRKLNDDNSLEEGEIEEN